MIKLRNTVQIAWTYFTMEADKYYSQIGKKTPHDPPSGTLTGAFLIIGTLHNIFVFKDQGPCSYISVLGTYSSHTIV